MSLRIEDQIQKQVPLNSALIRNKATPLYEVFVDDEPLSTKAYSKIFFASKEWFEIFKSRLSLQNLKLQGDAASANINVPLNILACF